MQCQGNVEKKNIEIKIEILNDLDAWLDRLNDSINNETDPCTSFVKIQYKLSGYQLCFDEVIMVDAHLFKKQYLNIQKIHRALDLSFCHDDYMIEKLLHASVERLRAQKILGGGIINPLKAIVQCQKMIYVDKLSLIGMQKMGLHNANSPPHTPLKSTWERALDCFKVTW